MSPMTAKQSYVLDNIDRVTPWQYSKAVRNPLKRYRLDGKDCTAQITSLSIRKMVFSAPDGSLRRSVGLRIRKHEPIGPRQQPSAAFLAELKASLLAPVNLQRKIAP